MQSFLAQDEKVLPHEDVVELALSAVDDEVDAVGWHMLKASVVEDVTQD